MKTRYILLTSFCLLAYATRAEDKTLARDYTLVDLNNRLTTKLLNVGTTSITFSVEWPLDIEIDYGWLYLIGKLDIEKRGWCELKVLDVDPAQGNTTFEILYNDIPWYYSENFKPNFEKKAFFAIRIPFSQNSPWGPSGGRYEEDDETDVFEGWWLNDTPTATTTEAQDAEQSGVQTSPSATTPADRQAQQTSPHLGRLETTDDELGVEEPNETNRLWLFAGIIFCLYAICHFLRKKSPKNQKMKP